VAVYRGNLIGISLAAIYAVMAVLETLVFCSLATQLTSLPPGLAGTVMMVAVLVTSLPVILLVLRWAKTRSFYPASFPARDPATAIAIGVVGVAGLSYCLVGIVRIFVGHPGFPGEISFDRLVMGYALVWISAVAHESFIRARLARA
jgi:hypothetical protein